MDNATNNLEDLIDQKMVELDLEQDLAKTDGATILLQKMSPQEMDRFSSVLTLGIRLGLGKIIGEKIQNSKEQIEALKRGLIEQLKDASADMEIKNLETKFNVVDFLARVYPDLSGKMAN